MAPAFFVPCIHPPACTLCSPDTCRLCVCGSQAGLAELPKSTFMIVMHASFLIEVQSSYQSGYTQLQVRNCPIVSQQSCLSCSLLYCFCAGRNPNTAPVQHYLNVKGPF